MASFKINNVIIEGIHSVVPRHFKSNIDNTLFSAKEVEDFIRTTGVEKFHYCDDSTTTADLGIQSANNLIEDLNINRSEIGLLIFVSQTPDYNCTPNTAPIIQERLSIPKTSMCFDMSLGCSGYTYGLGVLHSLLSKMDTEYGLLIVGDTPSKTINKKDKSTSMLFGDGAASTILRKVQTKNDAYFTFGTDGKGSDAILIKDGGYRFPVSQNSFKEKNFGASIVHNNLELSLNGMDVFSFGISRAPKSVKETLDYANFNDSDIDFYIFHQANQMMNEMIRKKLKLQPEKVPYSLANYGNTSSASIPITICDGLKLDSPKNVLMCGFGVGLSWSSAIVNLTNTRSMTLSEI